MPRNTACSPRRRPSMSPSAVRAVGRSCMPHLSPRTCSQLLSVSCNMSTVLEPGRPTMPKQVDHRERRETIARALWRVVEQRGIAHASVREVAQEAGISHGAVQHYFATREEMLVFAMDFASEQTSLRVAEGVRGLGDPPH